MGLEQFDPASLKALLDKLKPQPISVDLPSPQQPTGIDPEELRQTLTRANMMGIASKAANSYVPGAYGVMHGMRPMQLNEGSSDLVQQQGLVPLHAQQAAVDLANKQAAVTNNYNTEKAKLSLESQKANNAPTIAEMKGMINAAMLQPKLQNAQTVAQISADAKPKVTTLAPGAVPVDNHTGKPLGPPNGGSVGDIDPGVIEREADRYNDTAEVHTPKGLRGPQALDFVKRVMNRAQEKASAGGKVKPLASAASDYKSDTSTQAKLQTQASMTNAREDTALKNLDVFLETAKKVTDTGSPALNKPARWLDENSGDPDIAAFRAARQTAVSEIAQVLNNSGSQMTDSMRHEVSDLIGPNATGAQIVQAAGIAKRDMLNRRSANQHQIDVTRERIGGQSDKQIVKWQKNVNSGKRRPVYSDGSYGPEQ